MEANILLAATLIVAVALYAAAEFTIYKQNTAV